MDNKLDELPLFREDKASPLEVALLLVGVGLVVGAICYTASSICGYITEFCSELEDWVYSGAR